jgi:hypothetical protein
MTEELEKLFKRHRKAGVKAVYTKTAFKALYELSKSFHSESTWGFQRYQVNRHTHLIASAARLQRTHHFPSGFEGPRR